MKCHLAGIADHPTPNVLLVILFKMYQRGRNWDMASFLFLFLPIIIAR